MTDEMPEEYEQKAVELIANAIAMVYPETPQRKSYDEARAVFKALARHGYLKHPNGIIISEEE